MSNIKTYYKWCMVPLCLNNSKKTPDKVFIRVPEHERGKKWLKAARRNVTGVAGNSRFYCCEDHFDLPNDMENWIEYSMMKCKIRMKKDVIPHKFDCQPKAAPTIIVGNAAEKQRHQDIVPPRLIQPKQQLPSTFEKQINKLEDAKIELYELKKEIRKEQLRQEQLRTKILEAELQKTLAK